MTAAQISEYFGTKNSTVSNKAREIMTMLNISHFDSEFSTQRLIDSNPMNKMVLVDGFIVSIDSLPENVQIMVKEARAEGRDIEIRTN